MLVLMIMMTMMSMSDGREEQLRDVHDAHCTIQSVGAVIAQHGVMAAGQLTSQAASLVQPDAAASTNNNHDKEY